MIHVVIYLFFFGKRYTSSVVYSQLGFDEVCHFSAQVLVYRVNCCNVCYSGPDQLMFHGGEDGDDDEKAPKGCCLLNYVIGTLHKCFLYDRSSFVTKERFEILLLPLVNQVLEGEEEVDCL